MLTIQQCSMFELDHTYWNAHRTSITIQMASANNLFILFSFFSSFASNKWSHFVSFNNNAVCTTIATPAIFATNEWGKKLSFTILNVYLSCSLGSNSHIYHITYNTFSKQDECSKEKSVSRSFEIINAILTNVTKKKENFTLNAHFLLSLSCFFFISPTFEVRTQYNYKTFDTLP